jgi:hypothetical protein
LFLEVNGKDEIPLGPGDRDSKLRFYFRTGANLQPPPQQQLGSQDDLAAQFPDRLSVSLFKGTRRIVLAANHLSAVGINRREGYIKVEGDGRAAVYSFRYFRFNRSLKKFNLMRSMILPLRQVKMVMQGLNLASRTMIQQMVNGLNVKSWKYG